MPRTHEAKVFSCRSGAESTSSGITGSDAPERASGLSGKMGEFAPRRRRWRTRPLRVGGRTGGGRLMPACRLHTGRNTPRSSGLRKTSQRSDALAPATISPVRPKGPEKQHPAERRGLRKIFFRRRLRSGPAQRARKAYKTARKKHLYRSKRNQKKYPKRP